MSVCSLKMRLFTCFTLGAALTISRGINAQEPSPTLKQADADYRAGVAALSRNDLNTAREDFERVVHLAPSAEQGHSALGAVLVSLGHTTEGIHELEKALAIKPSDSSAQLNLAMAYEQSGQHAKALPWFAKAMAAAYAEKRAAPAAVLAVPRR